MGGAYFDQKRVTSDRSLLKQPCLGKQGKLL